jgi:hypothetical protein
VLLTVLFTLCVSDPVPDNLRQINGGDWKGAFEDSKGNLFVPGLRYFLELSDFTLKPTAPRLR